MLKLFLLRESSFTSLNRLHTFSSMSLYLSSSSSSYNIFDSSSTSHSGMNPYQPARSIQSSLCLSAGHNRWSKIHRKKAVADHERSLVISKYRQRIISAVQTGGGPDPDSNAKLASLISQAKAVGMAKAQIEPLLRPDTSKQVQKEQLLYEARAQAGYLILIEVLTGNRKRVRTELKILLSKRG